MGCPEGDVPANADGEGAVLPVAALYDGHLAPEEAAGPVEHLVRVAVVAAGGRVCVCVCGRRVVM